MTDGIDHERIERLIGGDRLADLRKRLRRHFERVEPDGARRHTLRLGRLMRHEYEALASLMGKPMRTSTSIAVDIATIDAGLARAGIAASLRAALEHIDGPIVHAATARAAADEAWQRVIAACGHAGLAAFISEAAGLGRLKRLARSDASAATALCERAVAVLHRLPAAGMTRAQLAAETLGDAHALDAGRPVASLVLAVLRSASSHSSAAADGDTNAEALRDERARTLWARSGIMVNELARPALVLNLPFDNGGCIGGRPGEPHYLSLRTLLRDPPSWRVAGLVVHVCENPNVVAIAADRLGAACRPLVCTEGMPAAAQRTLMEQIVGADGQLRYHGDFDWPGLRIANVVMHTTGAAPWRFSSADYLAAAARAPAHHHRLTGDEAEACWDASLRPAMNARDLAIAEEAVVDGLLQDLGANNSPKSRDNEHKM